MLFGSGLGLSVEASEKVEPEFYYLKNPVDSEDDVCLATSFTRHKALVDKENYPEGFNETTPTMITGFNGVYNQVAFLKNNETSTCQALSKDEPCSPKPDPVLNLASLTIFGLRSVILSDSIRNITVKMKMKTCT
ncbi:hypothetical protein OJAV_G00169910 [Oryzias javanicus]|uniref:Uncharacterized protein n=1 Tax=Oryzias javanicus TaxID=123683 RepID=A0A3S2PA65_ORYJA|nr:hypothetical protein OJAV_G00169910 [Oryzias javanicus]